MSYVIHGALAWDDMGKICFYFLITYGLYAKTEIIVIIRKDMQNRTLHTSSSSFFIFDKATSMRKDMQARRKIPLS